ncbi:hypothetical protein F7725_023103 [Dissostichus mawsoni]|uniref:Uncharacterized protein n=1 Tax=Dissostichus mawsoni TaxID=36200 RepID=A0A7J5Z3Z9_DISMA|nr:hypothetical protein F7725_023103 [Dissostichus mawsoni]
MGLTGFGVFFLFFGMVLFFDKALLAIGNILFVAGLSFVIGLERTFRFFFQKHKVKATSFFLGGGFFPVAVGFIRRVPVLGSLLSLPGISRLVDKIGESNNMSSTMSLIVTLLVVTLAAQCWTSPQKDIAQFCSAPAERKETPYTQLQAIQIITQMNNS